MEENKEKRGLHIHLGWSIIFIIIIIILFRIDIKDKVNSPQFQKNITYYIEDFFKDLWNNNVKSFYEKEIYNLSKNLINTGIETVQDGVDQKLDEMKK